MFREIEWPNQTLTQPSRQPACLIALANSKLQNIVCHSIYKFSLLRHLLFYCQPPTLSSHFCTYSLQFLSLLFASPTFLSCVYVTSLPVRLDALTRWIYNFFRCAFHSVAVTATARFAFLIFHCRMCKNGNASWPHKLLLNPRKTIFQSEKHSHTHKHIHHIKNATQQTHERERMRMETKKAHIERNKCYEFVSVFNWKMLLDSLPMVVFSLLHENINVMHFHTSSPHQTKHLSLLHMFLITSFFTLHNAFAWILRSIEAEIEGKMERSALTEMIFIHLLRSLWQIVIFTAARIGTRVCAMPMIFLLPLIAFRL